MDEIVFQLREVVTDVNEGMVEEVRLEDDINDIDEETAQTNEPPDDELLEIMVEGDVLDHHRYNNVQEPKDSGQDRNAQQDAEVNNGPVVNR